MIKVGDLVCITQFGAETMNDFYDVAPMLFEQGQTGIVVKQDWSKHDNNRPLVKVVFFHQPEYERLCYADTEVELVQGQ